MAFDRDTRTQDQVLQPLTRQELDQRIQHVAGQIASVKELDPVDGSEHPHEPRWITAEELVRKMEPFMVYN